MRFAGKCLKQKRLLFRDVVAESGRNQFLYLDFPFTVEFRVFLLSEKGELISYIDVLTACVHSSRCFYF